MSSTTILKKSQSVFLWIYNNLTNKFTTIFNKLRDRFPGIDRYPLFKYSLIPLLIAVFGLIRYVLKLGINELATWSSNVVGETSGLIVPESAIVLLIAVTIVMLRIGQKLRSQKKENNPRMGADLGNDHG
jgi:hypothetical protein